MRLTWQRRADTEQAHRVKAEKRRDDARADWPKVLHHAETLRHEKEINGWTATIATIFGAHPRGQQ